jgi:hypothetical protein
MFIRGARLTFKILAIEFQLSFTFAMLAKKHTRLNLTE